MNVLKSGFEPSEPKSSVEASKRTRAKGTLLAYGFFVFIIGLLFGLTIGMLQDPYADLTYERARKLVNVDREREEIESSNVDFGLFWQVWDAAKERYVDQPVDEVKLFYGALSGVIAGIGDPYSVFFNPEETAEFLAEINGSFEGIGVEIGIKNNQLMVIAPLPGSPAEAAGIQPGDRIMAIDGIDSTFMTLNVAVEAIRGEKGTSVTLTIQREGILEPFEVVIGRDVIQIESVKWEMVFEGEQRIALISIFHFNSDTPEKFQEAVNRVLLEQPTGIILDLRNNAGGFLEAAIDVTSMFLSEGSVVVIEQGSGATEKSYRAEGASPLLGIETVVLINEGSASAAEIVAGALKDHGVARLIGETSFGKGTVQDLETFEDGSSLKLTVARWLTPNGSLIDAVGIQPDHRIERTSDDYAASRDPQLNAAKLYFSDRAAFEQQYSSSLDTEEKN